MQIINEIGPTSVEFQTLKASDTFLVGANAYLKLETPLAGKDAVCLNDGTARSFTDTEHVIESPDAVLTLK